MVKYPSELAYVLSLVEKSALMPSEIVNIAQKAGTDDEHLFDVALAGWLPTHRHCYAVARFGHREIGQPAQTEIPDEIYCAAVSCEEGQYDVEDNDGRMPAHRR